MESWAPPALLIKVGIFTKKEKMVCNTELFSMRGKSDKGRRHHSEIGVVDGSYDGIERDLCEGCWMSIPERSAEDLKRQ